MEIIKLNNGVTIEYSNDRVILLDTEGNTSEVRFNEKGRTGKTFLERNPFSTKTTQKVKTYLKEL